MRKRCICPAFLLFLCLFAFISYILISTIFFSNDRQVLDLENIRRTARRIYKVNRGNNSSNDQNTCLLPNLDEWDPEIQKRMPMVKPAQKKCTPSINMLTSLNNGILKTNWKSSKCWFRCLRPIDDYNMGVDEFKPIDNEHGVKPGCDIIEVQCQRYFWFNYRFMHTQVVEKPKPSDSLPKNSDDKTPSFYWIAIDSVSSSMFKRAMRKTRNILLDKFQAIEFPYLNKIPLNTRPNSYAMFFGEQAYRLNSDPFGKHNQTESGRHPDEICKLELDNLNFIGYDFQKAGYHTSMTEDWALGVIDWPNCIGFKKPPADHFYRPFWLRLDGQERDIDRIMRSNMFGKSCKSYHNYDLEHTLNFADAYKGKPKFSLTWVTYLAHDDNTPLFDADYEFAEFFEKLNQKAKNAFIIFQADHGIRTGLVRDLPIIGEVEDNNPFLYVIVPEKLRKNPSLMKQLKENSAHLMSQFDMYASVLQIAKYSHEWTTETKFNQRAKPIKDRQLIGSSIFHQMNQPRTCSTLRIPFDFCICYQESNDLNDPALAKRVAQTIVDSINNQLEKSEYREKCQKHILSSKYPIRLETFVKKNTKERMLKAKFETLPGKALYQGFVQMSQHGELSLLQKDFPRLNMYADQAHCIPEGFFKNYCVC